MAEELQEDTPSVRYYYPMSYDNLGASLLKMLKLAKEFGQPIGMMVNQANLIVDPSSETSPSHLDLLIEYCAAKQFDEKQEEKFITEYYGSAEGREAAQAFGESSDITWSVFRHASKKLDKRWHEGTLKEKSGIILD
jgi:hypothetical protein